MQKSYDVIIIGCGISGLYAALNITPSKKVLLLCKRSLTLSNSALAQGGVAAVFDRLNDSEELHFADTLEAGGRKNNPESVRILVNEGPADVRRLFDFGVEFDEDGHGNIHLTLEGAHSRHRILHYKDSTGREIVEKLIYAALQLPNLTVMDGAHLIDAVKHDGGFSLEVLHEDDSFQFETACLVMASGGIGRIYERTTNSAIATGDGICIAKKLGAEVKDLSLVQFHPTAFAAGRHECFLISEAVRGEGAFLLNNCGERFMHRYDEREELAPRDAVSRAIIEESRLTGSNNFYLDITRKNPAFLKNRFPMIYKNLLIEGFDLTRDRIPIFPCQHYLMGGINVNLQSETCVPNLFAVGECSHTGAHGNNRLASNSLLEALVFSRRAAEVINSRDTSKTPAPFIFPPRCETVPPTKALRKEIRSIMQKSHFVVPGAEDALAGKARTAEMLEFLRKGGPRLSAEYAETLAIAEIANLILTEVTEPTF